MAQVAPEWIATRVLTQIVEAPRVGLEAACKRFGAVCVALVA
jgi:hypothetical protein